MDPNLLELAQKIAVFLSPLLPYLFKIGDKAAEEVGKNRQGESAPQAPGYAWLGTCVVLSLILFGLLTRSGFAVRGDPDALHIQIIQAHYCEQVDCVPEDVMRWLR